MLSLVFLTHESWPDPADIRYRVRIDGVSRDVRLELRDISDAVTFIRKPPPSEIFLRRRAERDIDRFKKYLKSHAYFDPSIEVRIDTEVTPALVYFDVDKGPRYVLRDLVLDHMDPKKYKEDTAKLPDPEDLGLKAGDPAVTKTILDARDFLTARLMQQGYPFAEILSQDVVVDHRTREVSVTYVFKTGSPVDFGNTEIRGLETIKEDYLRRQILWQEGERYNHDSVRRLQRRLLESELYASVRVLREDELDEYGRLPIVVELKERTPRSAGIGGSYRTDEGFGGKVTWEHRNRFGRGERLNISGTMTEIGYAVELGLRKPDFQVLDQTIRMTLRIAEEETDAFTSRNYGASILLDRQVTRRLAVGSGLAFKYSEVEQRDIHDRFSLVYFPSHMDWDTSDDILNPGRGGRLTLRGAPYLDVSDTDLHFLKGRAGYARYIRVLRRPEIILAGRAMVGSIVGVSNDNIPADERFYAGGGGTVRGYPFQTVGPLDGDVPIGGRSLFVLSGEVRMRATEQLGFSIFADGGSAYENTMPQIDEDILWGAGIGLRYFTPIGPLRMDIAVPLDRRRDIDDKFQIYVSIGQAF